MGTELLEVERASEAVIDELESKFEQIVVEKKELAAQLADVTHQLNQSSQETQNSSSQQLQEQLREKEDEISQLKSAHQKETEELRKSKMVFITQSVTEIERLKSVIRSFHKNRPAEPSPAPSSKSWLSGWV